MITFSIPYFYKHYEVGLIGIIIAIIFGILGYVFSIPNFYNCAIIISILFIICILTIECAARCITPDEFLPKKPRMSVMTSYSEDAISLKYFDKEGNVDKFYEWASNHLYFKINNEDLKYVMIPGHKVNLRRTIYKEQFGIYTTTHSKSGMLVPMCHQSLKYYYDKDFVVYRPLIMTERKIGNTKYVYSYTIPPFGVLFRVYLLFHLFPIDVCIKLGKPYIERY